jgi:hypothetical protein
MAGATAGSRSVLNYPVSLLAGGGCQTQFRIVYTARTIGFLKLNIVVICEAIVVKIHRFFRAPCTPFKAIFVHACALLESYSVHLIASFHKFGLHWKVSSPLLRFYCLSYSDFLRPIYELGLSSADRVFQIGFKKGINALARP